MRADFYVPSATGDGSEMAVKGVTVRFDGDFAWNILQAIEAHPQTVVYGLSQIRETLDVEVGDGQGRAFSTSEFVDHCVLRYESGYIFLSPHPHTKELNPHLALALTNKGRQYLAANHEAVNLAKAADE